MIESTLSKWRASVSSRVFPLVLLLIMIVIALWIEWAAFPPVRLAVKGPILILVVSALIVHRADRSDRKS